jgi:hypothetical protein
LDGKKLGKTVPLTLACICVPAAQSLARSRRNWSLDNRHVHNKDPLLFRVPTVYWRLVYYINIYLGTFNYIDIILYSSYNNDNKGKVLQEIKNNLHKSVKIQEIEFFLEAVFVFQLIKTAAVQ